MNKRLVKLNLFNWRNTILIIGSLIFILSSVIILLLQRNGYENINFLENSYLIISIIFIIFLMYSLFQFLYPIIKKINKNKVNSLNNRFTLYFISISLTPALIVGVLGVILINLGINDWFNQKIKNIVFNSVSVAESYLEEHKESIKGDIYAMSNDLNNASELFSSDIDRFKEFFRTQSVIRSLPETFLIDNNGNVIFKALPSNSIYYKPPNESIKKAIEGDLAILTSIEANKVYALINLNNYNGMLLYAGRSMDPDVLVALNDTRSAKREYTILENNRNQISLVFVIFYLVTTLLLILVSIIVGVRTAQRIVKPISNVIKASNNISRGNYEDKIMRTNDYIELNRLADSFNKMSRDLVKQRNQLAIAKKHETWSDIARRIAHEIKNPLTPIQLSSERLVKKIKNSSHSNDPEIKECIESITRQVNEIGLLVDEFSNFARLPNPEFSNVKICELLENCISDIKNNFQFIDFHFSNENQDIILECDKNQISRVIQNILINSINSINEHSDDKTKGVISCSSYVENNSFLIEIIDNGLGIKYEKNELVKPYFTTRKKSGGSGLGLSIVEKILSDHNADFDIYNRKDGLKGAVTKLSFSLK